MPKIDAARIEIERHRAEADKATDVWSKYKIDEGRRWKNIGTGRQIAAGIAVVGGVALSLAKGLSDTVVELDRMAARTGVNITNLQVMRDLIEDAGGDAGGLAELVGR